MDATSLYYLFSTIAQALAAAMALLAGIALYALQRIDAQCEGAHRALHAANFPLTSELWTHAHLHEWPEYLAALPASIEGRGLLPAGREVFGSMRLLLPKLLRAETQVRADLWISLGLTAVVMIGSVWVIAQVPWLCSAGYGGAAEVLGIVGFSACVFVYGRLAWRIVVTPSRRGK